MPRPIGCQFCRTALDAAQEFAFHVQSLTATDRHPLLAGRPLPRANGKPLQCCRDCTELICSGRCEVRDAHAATRAAGLRLMVSAALLVGTGAVTLKLGRWLAGSL